MDNKTIFTKTAKGLGEAVGKTKALSRDFRNILKEIDGKAAVEELQDKLGNVSEAKLQDALTALVNGDYIREFASPTAEVDVDLDFTLAPNANPDDALTSLTMGAFLREVSSPADANKPGPKPAERPSATEVAVQNALIDEILREEQEVRAKEDAARNAKAVAEAQAKKNAEEQARREAEARAKKDAEEKAHKAAAEAAERARREAEEKARREAEAQAKKDAEENARKEALEAAERARREAEEEARRAAEQQAKKDAAEKARLEAEERVRQEAEEKARRKAVVAQIRREAIEKYKHDTEERARKEAEEKARLEAEAQARQEAEEQARRDAEEQARRDAEAQAQREAEEKFRLEAEAKARQEAEEQAHRDSEEQARRDAEEQAQREADERERLKEKERIRLEAEQQARWEAEEEARLAAEEQAKKQAEREAKEKSRLEAEAKAQKEAEERARRKTQEKEERAKREAAKQAEWEAKRQAEREAQEQARLAAEARAKQEAEERARQEEEAVRRAPEEAAEAQAREQLEAEEQARQQAAREAEQEAAYQAEQAAIFSKPDKPHRKPVKWGKFVAPILVFLAVVGVVGVQTMPFDEQARLIEKAAAGQFQQPVKIGKVQLALLPQPHWQLERVSIGKDAQISAARIDATAELSTLFSDEIIFKTIEFTSLLVKEEGLGWFLFGKPQGRNFKNLVISASSVTVDKQSIGLPAVDVMAEIGADGTWQKMIVEDANKKTRIELQPKNDAVQIELSAEAFAALFGSSFPLEKISARGTVSRNEIMFTEFNGTIYDGIIKGNARLTWGAGWALAGDVAMRQLDAAKWMPQLLEGGKLEGNAKYALQAQTANQLFSAPRLKGNFEISNGTVLGVELGSLLRGSSPGGKSSFSEGSGGFVYESGKAQLRNVQLRAGLVSATGNADVDANNNLNGHFTINLTAPTRQARANLTVSGTFKEPRFGP